MSWRRARGKSLGCGEVKRTRSSSAPMSVGVGWCWLGSVGVSWGQLGSWVGVGWRGLVWLGWDSQTALEGPLRSIPLGLTR